MRFIPAANPSENWHRLPLHEDCRDTDKEKQAWEALPRHINMPCTNSCLLKQVIKHIFKVQIVTTLAMNVQGIYLDQSFMTSIYYSR